MERRNNNRHSVFWTQSCCYTCALHDWVEIKVFIDSHHLLLVTRATAPVGACFIYTHTHTHILYMCIHTPCIYTTVPI